MTFYTYGHYTESGRLFYIGKGRGSRCFSRADRNKRWKNIVTRDGLKVEVFSTWKTEQEAFEHERFLISCFRNDLDFKLANYTDGGEGSSGFKMPDAVKQKISKVSKDLWKNSEYLVKMKDRPPGGFSEKKKLSSLATAKLMREKLVDPEVKRQAAVKNSEQSKNMWAQPGFKEAMSAKHKSSWSVDRRASMSAQTTGRVRVTNGLVERNVTIEQAEKLFAQGWKRGRGPNSPSKRSGNPIN